MGLVAGLAFQELINPIQPSPAISDHIFVVYVQISTYIGGDLAISDKDPLESQSLLLLPISTKTNSTRGNPTLSNLLILFG